MHSLRCKSSESEECPKFTFGVEIRNFSIMISDSFFNTRLWQLALIHCRNLHSLGIDIFNYFFKGIFRIYILCIHTHTNTQHCCI